MNGKQHIIGSILFALTAVVILFFVGYRYAQVTGYVMMFFLLAVAGAVIPDIDFWFGIDKHRSPITHSIYIVYPLFFYWLFWGDVLLIHNFIDSPIIFGYTGFLIGYLSHLFLDNYPSNLTKLSYHVEKRTVPGDIRHIDEKYEHPWLIGNAFMILLMIILLLIKSYGYVGFYPIWDGTRITISPVVLVWLFIIDGMFISFVFVTIHLWDKNKRIKKKKKKRRKKKNKQ